MLKFIFLTIFMASSYYIWSIETQKYESKTILTVKDLSKEQSVSSLSSLVLGQGDVKTQQNLELISLYLRSREVFEALDKDFNLTSYYSGKDIDPLHRLYPNLPISYHKLGVENLVAVYNNDIDTIYDPLSATLNLSFYHADANISKKIVKKMIKYAEKAINKFDNESAIILVNFLKKQEKHYKNKLTQSVRKLIQFQNKAGLIDPKINIESTSKLLASLESELIKLQVEYQAKSVSYAKLTPQVKMLKKQIDTIQSKIYALNKKLSGGGSKLNKNQLTYEILKNNLKFDQELYYQTLLKLEDAKIAANQKSKKLIKVVEPTMPEQPSRPNKLKNIITLLLVLIFLYSIVKIGLDVLREHKD